MTKTRPSRTHDQQWQDLASPDSSVQEAQAQGQKIPLLILYVNNSMLHGTSRNTLGNQTQAEHFCLWNSFLFSFIDQIYCWALWFQIAVPFNFTICSEEPDYVYAVKIWLSVDTCHHRFSMTHPDPAIVVSQDIFRISSEKIKGFSRFLFERESPDGACTKVTLGLQASAINQWATIPQMRLCDSSQCRERVYREGWLPQHSGDGNVLRREKSVETSTLPSPNTKWLLTEPRKINVS